MTWRIGHRFWYRWGNDEILAVITFIIERPGFPRHYHFRDLHDVRVTGYITEYGMPRVRPDNPNQDGGK